MQFVYKATSKEGKIIRGVLEANDSSLAASYLRKQGFLPIRIAPRASEGFFSSLFIFNRIGYSDTVFFTRQLSSILSAGLTLMQALNILKSQMQKQVMVNMITSLITDIEEGKTLSMALSKFPNAFDHIYVSLIKAAENSGLLDKVLVRLADNLEKNQKLRSTIKSALMYPIIILVVMVLVVIVMMVLVIPQLATLYENLNLELPLPTQIIIGMSNGIINFWPFLIGTVFLIVFVFRRWHKTESGRFIFDSLLLRVPIFGKLNNKVILAEFTRTLGLLIGSGTLVVESFKETADIAGNLIYENAINGVARRVEKGVAIGDALLAYPLFPPILVEMVKIGEQTGKLDDSLQKVSEYFERDVDQSVKTLTTVLEPVIIVILAVGVCFLIISIITPIYKLTSSIQ